MKISKRQLSGLINRFLLKENLLPLLFYTAKGGDELEQNLSALVDAPIVIPAKTLIYTVNNIAKHHKEVADALKQDDVGLMSWICERIPKPTENRLVSIFTSESGNVEIDIEINVNKDIFVRIFIDGPLLVNFNITYSICELMTSYLTQDGFESWIADLKSQILSDSMQDLIKRYADEQQLEEIKKKISDEIDKNVGNNRDQILDVANKTRESIATFSHSQPAALMALCGLDWWTDMGLAEEQQATLEDWAQKEIQEIIEQKVASSGLGAQLGKAMIPLDREFEKINKRFQKEMIDVIKNPMSGIKKFFN